jgi:hypothetical protein
MPGWDFHTYYSALPDDELRALFLSTLEKPASLEAPHAEQWKGWLVSSLLSHFHDRPPHTDTGRRRYLAFALRYLAAVETNAQEAYCVRLVSLVMERRPEIVAGLLFGSVEERRQALVAAFDSASGWHGQDLQPFEEAILQAYLQRFAERQSPAGVSAFDESTVAKWSRDLIPEMERLVVERFRPARRVAQGETLRQFVRGRPGRDLSERARLAAFVEQCEHRPPSVHYAVALSALNDFDRRQENEEGYFKTVRVMVLAACGLLLGSGLLLAAPRVLGWSEGWMELVRAVRTLLGAAGLGLLFLGAIRIGLGLVTATDHITRTRTDIQTLQQLVDMTSEKERN